jgi:short-subunit dehydrogenase
MENLRGTNAILTGASRGIGVYIARALAREGVNLSLAARSLPELEKVRSEIEGLGVKAIATECDVADAAARQRLIDRTESELGSIDILVNNAGIERTTHFETADEDDLLQTLDINLTAPLMFIRAIVPGMLQRGRGHVVNIASGAGKIGVPYGVSYSTSKHGLVGMTHALRGEFHDRPVGFSVVCPGFVTDAGMYVRMVENGAKAPKIAGSSKPEKVASVVVECIRKDKAEVLVNTPPIRPLIVLSNIIPGIAPTLLKRLGYSEVFRKTADFEDKNRLSSGR